MEEKRQRESYGLHTWIGLAGLTLAAMLAAVCLGNVDIPVRECLQVFRAALTGTEASATDMQEAGELACQGGIHVVDEGLENLGAVGEGNDVVIGNSSGNQGAMAFL